MKELDFKNLIKKVEKEEKGIEDYIEMINETPILNDKFIYNILNKDDKEEIRKKLKEITIKCIELTDLCYNANKKQRLALFEKNPVSKELYEIIKVLLG